MATPSLTSWEAAVGALSVEEPVSYTHLDVYKRQDMDLSRVELEDALAQHVKDKGQMPEMDHAALARDYPVLYQSMLQLIHNLSLIHI